MKFKITKDNGISPIFRVYVLKRIMCFTYWSRIEYSTNYDRAKEHLNNYVNSKTFTKIHEERIIEEHQLFDDGSVIETINRR